MTFWNSSLRRKPIGEARRANVQSEATYSRTFEELLRLHRCDWWHNYNAQRSQPGWPDYTIFGDGWHAWVELKARSTATNRRGKLSQGQLRYKETIEAGGGEWRSFTLPDDWDEVDEWLNNRTGKEIWGWAANQRTGLYVPPEAIP